MKFGSGLNQPFLPLLLNPKVNDRDWMTAKHSFTCHELEFSERLGNRLKM
jgi:hypothetical protein